MYPLLALPLAGVNEDALKSWYDREAVAGKHQAEQPQDVAVVRCAVRCGAAHGQPVAQAVYKKWLNRLCGLRLQLLFLKFSVGGHSGTAAGAAFPSTMSAPLSPITTAAALVLPDTRCGMTEASITRS